MTTHAINSTAIIALVNDLTDRVDELLAVTGDDATPAMAQPLYDLGDEIADATEALAHAATAIALLRGLQFRLLGRARACAEVFGTRFPDGGDFTYRERIAADRFGKRFAGVPVDDDVPF